MGKRLFCSTNWLLISIVSSWDLLVSTLKQHCCSLMRYTMGLIWGRSNRHTHHTHTHDANRDSELCEKFGERTLRTLKTTSSVRVRDNSSLPVPSASGTAAAAQRDVRDSKWPKVASAPARQGTTTCDHCNRAAQCKNNNSIRALSLSLSLSWMHNANTRNNVPHFCTMQ